MSCSGRCCPRPVGGPHEPPGPGPRLGRVACLGLRHLGLQRQAQRLESDSPPHSTRVGQRSPRPRCQGVLQAGRASARVEDGYVAKSRPRPRRAPPAAWGRPPPAAPSAASGGPSPPGDPLGASRLTSSLLPARQAVALKSSLSLVLRVATKRWNSTQRTPGREGQLPAPGPAAQAHCPEAAFCFLPDGRPPAAAPAPPSVLGPTPDPGSHPRPRPPPRPAFPAAHQVLPTQPPPPPARPSAPAVPTASDQTGPFRPLSASEAFRQS